MFLVLLKVPGIQCWEDKYLPFSHDADILEGEDKKIPNIQTDKYMIKIQIKCYQIEIGSQRNYFNWDLNDKTCEQTANQKEARGWWGEKGGKVGSAGAGSCSLCPLLLKMQSVWTSSISITGESA